MNIKELRRKMFNIVDEFGVSKDIQLLEQLYSLHGIVNDMIILDEDVRSRILAAIKKEQVKLEEKYVMVQ
jgi:hypothetical protein